MMRRVLATLGLSLAALGCSASVASAAVAPAAEGQVIAGPAGLKTIGECYEAPMPVAPTADLMWTPNDRENDPSDGKSLDKDHDPFLNKSIPPQLVYGFNPTMVVYDNGCGPVGAIMPGVGAAYANTVGLTIPATLESWGYAAMRNSVDPGWLGSWDQAVSAATKSVAASVWTPWLSLAMLILSAVVLWRVRGGVVASAITGICWMLTILTLVSWTIAYPTEAPRLVDEGVQGATVQIADAFAPPQKKPAGKSDPSPNKDSQAVKAVDRLWGEVWWNTIYRTWASGTFGSADSPTAKKYGRAIYMYSHFTVAEWKQYQKDPGGKGREISMNKKKRFDYWAKQVKENDPAAYQYLTGNKWGQRMSTASIGAIVTLSVAFFMVVAGIVILLSYVIIRVGIPFAPAVGVLAVFDWFKDMVVKGGQKIVQFVIGGPLLLVAALVVMRIDQAVWGSKAPVVVQFIVVIATSVIAWKIVKPKGFLPKMPGLGSLTRLAKSAALFKMGEKVGNAENGDAPRRSTSSVDHAPVDTGAEPRGGPFAGLPPGRREDVDAAPDSVPEYHAASLRTPGTFVAREPVGQALPSGREQRLLSAGASSSAEGRGSDSRQLPAAGTESGPRPMLVLPPAARSSEGVDDGWDEREGVDDGWDEREGNDQQFIDDERPHELASPIGTHDDAGDSSSTSTGPAPQRATVTVGYLPRSGDDELSSSPDESTGQAGPRVVNEDDYAGSRVRSGPQGDASAPYTAAEGSDGTYAHPETYRAAESDTAPPVQPQTLEPSAVWMPATQERLSEVHEANVTYDDAGQPEFVIYKPEGSETYGVVSE